MLGGAVAAMLAENQDRLNIPTGVEALLRAGIAAAEFAIDAYVAMLAGSYKSQEAMNHLDEARSRCDRSLSPTLGNSADVWKASVICPQVNITPTRRHSRPAAVLHHLRLNFLSFEKDHDANQCAFEIHHA